MLIIFIMLYICFCSLVTKSCLTFVINKLYPARFLCPWDYFRQESWGSLPFPPPGDLPNPGTESVSPALQANSLLLSHQGSPMLFIISLVFIYLIAGSLYYLCLPSSNSPSLTLPKFSCGYL